MNQPNMHTCVQKLNNDNIELMDMNEIDEDSNAIHHDILLHEEDIPHADPESFPQTNEYFSGCRCGIFSFSHNFLWSKMKRE